MKQGVAYMYRQLYRVEFKDEKLIFTKVDFSLKDLVAKGAKFFDDEFQLEFSGKTLACFFTKAKSKHFNDYEPLFTGFPSVVYEGCNYIEIREENLKGGRDSLDKFSWDGEYGLEDDIPIFGYRDVIFVNES